MRYIYQCRECGLVSELDRYATAPVLCPDDLYEMRRDYRAEAVNVDKGSLR